MWESDQENQGCGRSRFGHSGSEEAPLNLTGRCTYWKIQPRILEEPWGLGLVVPYSSVLGGWDCLRLTRREMVEGSVVVGGGVWKFSRRDPKKDGGMDYSI